MFDYVRICSIMFGYVRFAGKNFRLVRGNAEAGGRNLTSLNQTFSDEQSS